MKKGAAKHLDEMLGMARIRPEPTYKPCQVRKILNISASTLERLCFAYNPNQITGKHGLRSFFAGHSRRVQHEAIIEMMEFNDNYRIEKEQ